MRLTETRLSVVTFGLHLGLFTALSYHAEGKHVVVYSLLSYGRVSNESVPEDDFYSSQEGSKLEVKKKLSGSLADEVTASITGTVVAGLENVNSSLPEETFSNINEIVAVFEALLQKRKVLSLPMNFGLDGISHWETGKADIPDLQDECPPGFVYDPFGFVCRPTFCVRIEDPAGKDFTCTTERGHLREAINIPPNATSVVIQILLALENATANFDRLRSWQRPLEHRTETVLRLELETRLEHLRVHPSQIGIVSVPIFFRRDCASVVVRSFHGDPSNPSHLSSAVLDKPTVCNTSKDNNLEHLIQVPVSVALTRPPQCKIPSDSLVRIFAHLAKQILMNNFTFEVDGFKLIAQGIKVESENGTKEYISDQAWCTPGVVSTYINEEFTVSDYYGNITDTRMFVKETGMTYHAGDFRFQVLLRTEDMHVTMCQIAHACQRPLEYPESETSVADGAIMLQNYSLWYINQTYIRWEYYPNPRTKICKICGVSKRSAFQLEDLVLEHVFGDLSGISVALISLTLFFLLSTLIIYGIFKDLRTLPGWNLINIMVAEVICQTALLLNNVVGERYFCYANGVITHYAFLVQFFSANVIAWDIFSKFGRTGASSLIYGYNRPVAKRVVQNMAYSYLSSAVFVAVAVILEELHPEHWAAGYAEFCWIAGTKVNAICFAFPLLGITMVDSILFVLTFKRMRAHKKIVKGLLVSGRKEHKSKKEALTYMKIMSALGFMGIFGIAAGMTKGLIPDDKNFAFAHEVLFTVYLLTETILGFFIFLVFGINPLVRKRIRNLCSQFRLKKCEKCKQRFCTCAVDRSIPAGIRCSVRIELADTSVCAPKLQESSLEPTNQTSAVSTLT